MSQCGAVFNHFMNRTLPFWHEYGGTQRAPTVIFIGGRAFVPKNTVLAPVKILIRTKAF